MYDIKKLISITNDYLDAARENKLYNLEIRKRMGYSPNAELWMVQPLLRWAEKTRVRHSEAGG